MQWITLDINKKKNTTVNKEMSEQISQYVEIQRNKQWNQKKSNESSSRIGERRGYRLYKNITSKNILKLIGDIKSK